MKRGKACGPDNLNVEHLLYAHPSIVIYLKLLFALIMSHGYVPNEFGCGVIVPLAKDKSADLNSSDNYRPITLIPNISKVFENVLLTVCEDSMLTNELQFGFKSGVRCADAIFLLKATVGHFVSNGSCVFFSCLRHTQSF